MKKVKLEGFMQAKIDQVVSGFEHAFSSLELMPDIASGAKLDDIVLSVTGLSRMEGEGDNSFRQRVSSSLTLDEDARFADKVAAAVKDFDAEEEEAEL